MKTFPIMLAVRGRRVVVVGGGPVGLRKAQALAEAGAQVTLVDEHAGPIEAAGLTVLREPYHAALVAGAMLVFACTDNREVNHRVAADARAAGALVNVADQSEDCDFFSPAVWSDGDVVVAVGTGGVAPALAACLRDWIAPSLPRGLGRFAQALGELRETLATKVPDAQRRRDILRGLCSRQILEAFLAEGPSALHRKLSERLGEQPPR